MKIVLTGATGLIGNICVTKLLDNPVVSLVEVWVRKELSISHPKLIQRVIDFDHLLQLQVEQRDVFICCLGSTIKKSGTQEKFRQIDHDYVVNFAQIAEKGGVRTFIVVSSMGANDKSRNFYLRTKGQMEAAIQKCNIPSIFILRPSLLLGNRTEKRTGEKFAQIMMRLLGFMFVGKLRRFKAIEAETVASKITMLIQSNIRGVSILESEMIQD